MIREQIRKKLKKSIRNGAGVREIARATGISPSVVSRIVSGEREISGANADRLAEWLRVKLVDQRR